MRGGCAGSPQGDGKRNLWRVQRASSAANLVRVGRDQELRRLQDEFRMLKVSAAAPDPVGGQQGERERKNGREMRGIGRERGREEEREEERERRGRGREREREREREGE